jgi:hypothetical protein
VVVDDERGGCPKSIRTEVNNSAVADLVRNDFTIASRMIAESLNIPKAVVLRIMKEDLGNRKLCARFCSALLDTSAKGRSSHMWPFITFFRYTSGLVK